MSADLTLEIAGGFIGLASEGHLWPLLAEQVRDLLICNIAYLVVVVDDLAICIADAAISSLHESVASLVFCTYVAVDSSPAIVAFALVAIAHRSVFTTSKRAAYWEPQVSYQDPNLL